MAEAQHKPSMTVAQFFQKNASDNAITASQLAELIADQTGTERDPKTVRAHLRRMKARDQSELKGANWRINRKVADQVVKHYSEAKKVS